MTEHSQDGAPQPNGGDNEPTPAQPNGGKTFTQEQVNSIVEGRLAKEKEKYADYDALKTKATEYESLNQKHAELKTQAESLESSLKNVYEDMIASVPEDKKSLIPDQLSLNDKISYVIKNKSSLISAAQTPPPQTPPKPEEGKGDGGLYVGKYSTLWEFQKHDLKGYLEYRRNGGK